MTVHGLQPTEAQTDKVQSRVSNWPDYDRARLRRGRLRIGFDDVWLNARWPPAPPGRRGAPLRDSDAALQALRRLKAGFDLPYRRVEGVAGSSVRLLGLARSIPDHTRLSRRAKTRPVERPRRARTGPLPLVVESTGLTVCGEGDWTVRQQGAGKRRTGRKVHGAVEAQATAVRAVEVTPAQWSDGDVVAGVLEPLQDPIAQVDADGAYATRAGYAAAATQGADLGVPPREKAVPWATDPPRTPALADLASHPLSAWKRAKGDPHRRLAAKAIERFNPLVGERLGSGRFDTQVTELPVRVAAFNVRTSLGMPVSVPVGGSLSGIKPG